jgi:two-component system, LuxR family, response regulator FixJ
MKSGAIEFVEKPVNDKVLLDAIKRGLADDAERLRLWQDREEYTKRVAALSSLEREVMQLISQGKSEPEIAQQLNRDASIIKIAVENTNNTMGVHNSLQLMRFVKLHSD